MASLFEAGAEADLFKSSVNIIKKIIYMMANLCFVLRRSGLNVLLIKGMRSCQEMRKSQTILNQEIYKRGNRMLRRLIDLIIKILGRLKRNRRVLPLIDVSDGLVKVNLGCGLRVANGWLNIDGSLNALIASWPNWAHRLIYRFSGSHNYYSIEEYCQILENHTFLYHDLSLSLPLHENSVDFIYSSHFFEHLFKDDAAALLKSCARALKPGGAIRISIPDLAYAVSLYGLGRKTELLDDYFFVEGKGSYLARHKYMYDFELIKQALELSGFLNVIRCEYRQGKTPDIKALDVYPDVSLFVEAVRGNSNV